MLHLSTEVDIEFNVMQFIKVYVRYCRSFARSCGLCEQRESQISTSHIIKSMGVINMYANERARALFCACTWNCIEIFCFFFLVSVFITYACFCQCVIKTPQIIERILSSSYIVFFNYYNISTYGKCGWWLVYVFAAVALNAKLQKTNEWRRSGHNAIQFGGPSELPVW